MNAPMDLSGVVSQPHAVDGVHRPEREAMLRAVREIADGPLAGKLVAYLRDPDGITVELVQQPPTGRAFDALSPYADPLGGSSG
ncbi:MAG: VOC family protein, partial [Burkholderiaceae bacterium]